MTYKLSEKSQDIILDSQIVTILVDLYAARAAAMAGFAVGRKIAVGSGDSVLVGTVTGVKSTATRSDLRPDVNVAIDVDYGTAGLRHAADGLPTIVELTRKAEQAAEGLDDEIQELLSAHFELRERIAAAKK